MISDILISINIAILLSLALIHLYWAFGGTWAIEYTIPDKFKEHYFHPNNRFKISAATIVVAIGLLLFALITASNYLDIMRGGWQNHVHTLTQIIGVVFTLRAIGDFNLFGIFKKKCTSKFAHKDSQLYIPLCLYMGISSILIPIITK